MENPARTRQFLSVIKERKDVLKQSLAQILPHSKELVCEFGCGHGHFLVAYAQAHPGATCIGLDIDGDRIERAQRKQQRAKLHDLHFLQADAGLFLEVLPVDAVFTHIFVLFPDPWPKKRHHKHRLIQPAFLMALRLQATARTRLFFRTDFEPYFEAARETIVADPGWQLADEPWLFEYETVFQKRAESFRSLVAQPRPIQP